MERETSDKHDYLDRLLRKLRPSDAERAELEAADRSGDAQLFARKQAELDRKYKVRSIDTLGVDKKLINADAFRRAKEGAAASLQVAGVARANLIGKLIATNQLECPCLTLFEFLRVDVYGGMSGPGVSQEEEMIYGIIGANRRYSYEYTVSNLGDTEGKGRVPIDGHINIVFQASLSQAGPWCLLFPDGLLRISGHSRVVGQGNMTTGWDAKVYVAFHHFLKLQEQTLELSGQEIHSDATRSEDRTKDFRVEFDYPSRYLFFNATAGSVLQLILRLGVHTEANEDGIATVSIDQFGFPSNGRHDHDSWVIKAGPPPWY